MPPARAVAVPLTFSRRLSFPHPSFLFLALGKTRQKTLGFRTAAKRKTRDTHLAYHGGSIRQRREPLFG
jgi:hypothetical protein